MDTTCSDTFQRVWNEKQRKTRMKWVDLVKNDLAQKDLKNEAGKPMIPGHQKDVNPITSDETS